eukprot:6210115-Pleurochrysis_carterae.AAC.2
MTLRARRICTCGIHISIPRNMIISGRRQCDARACNHRKRLHMKEYTVKARAAGINENNSSICTPGTQEPGEDYGCRLYSTAFLLAHFPHLPSFGPPAPLCVSRRSGLPNIASHRAALVAHRGRARLATRQLLAQAVRSRRWQLGSRPSAQVAPEFRAVRIKLRLETGVLETLAAWACMKSTAWQG